MNLTLRIDAPRWKNPAEGRAAAVRLAKFAAVLRDAAAAIEQGRREVDFERLDIRGRLRLQLPEAAARNSNQSEAA
jgi:hypothetical protein